MGGLVAVNARLPVDLMVGSAEQLCVLQDHFNHVFITVHLSALGWITI